MTSDKKKVLVVEDNRVMSDVIHFNLERAGFDVRVCGNGRQAVELLDCERFDVIITDFQMPKMNGEELCRHVRQDVRHADLPILMISAKGFELDVARLTEELSLAKVLSKPFSPREVVESVRAVLEPVVV
ncbi:MAG: response regulator [Planctomycetes bacterium]|nr:response regulator [Planctomycetota bacterium]